jgi:hypothetical protein
MRYFDDELPFLMIDAATARSLLDIVAICSEDYAIIVAHGECYQACNNVTV